MLFNDVDLAQWLIVSDVQRNVGTSHTNTTVKIGNSDGSLWQNMSRNSSTIVVTGILHGDLAALRRTFAGAIDYDEPKVLVFGDEPDVYYNAIYDGQPTMTELSHTGTVSLSFLVPDGVAHSVAVSTASLDDSGQIAIDNRGSYPTWPVITATMKGDNGLVAMVNDNGGVLEFGNPDEIDGVTKQKSDKAFYCGFDGSHNGMTENAGTGVYLHYLGDSTKPNTMHGSFEYVSNSGTTGIQPVFNNSTDTDWWAGPSLHAPITKNSNSDNTGNFIFRNRIHLDSSTTRQGHIQFCLQNGSNVAFSIVLRSSSSSKDTLDIEAWAGTTRLTNVSVDRKKFTDGFYEVKITRLASTIQYSLAKVTGWNKDGTPKTGLSKIISYNLDDFANTPVDSLTVWFMRFKKTEHIVMDLTDCHFDWVNVDYWSDLPNRWGIGDEVRIDTAQRRVYVNGVIDNTLQRVGNDWDKFKLAPGLNIIQPVCSNWAEMYDCTVTYREAWK